VPIGRAKFPFPQPMRFRSGGVHESSQALQLFRNRSIVPCKAMQASEVTHEPSRLSPRNTGQLPFEFWIPKRNCVARSWALWNSGPRAMHVRAVGSRAGCDDDDKAAHPPLGNCFCANNRRRSSTETSRVVTIVLLYCRLPILSNCVRRLLVDSSTDVTTRQKEECRRVHHPKCE
jgi:hypothetical protein